MRKISPIMLLLVISVGYALPIEPAIFVNKSTVDYENAKILMDNFYSSRAVSVDNDNLSVAVKDIAYIPAVDELDYNGNNEKLVIKFKKEGDEIKYKDIKYTFYSNLAKGNTIRLLGKDYVVEDIGSDYVILRDANKEEIKTNESFKFGEYSINITLVSFDSNTVYADVYKNNKLLKSIKLRRGEFYQLENGDLGILYKNYTENFKKRTYFIFDVYYSIKLEKDKTFVLDDRFIVGDIDTNGLKFVYKNVDDIKSDKLELFNITVIPEKCYDDYVIFKVIKRDNEVLDMKDNTVGYVGNGIYAIKTNDTINVYYKGKKLKNHEKIYVNSLGILDVNPLNISNDVVLIGGSKVNKFVKELEDKKLLRVEITNEFPGAHRGVIQKIKNPYSDSNIYILAGSDRWGTKAAITAFLTMYNDEDVLIVDWNNGDVKVIK
jgi:hypothetical protein